MQKTSTGFIAVLETAKSNYLVQMQKLGRGVHEFTIYTEGDQISRLLLNNGKKATFTKYLRKFVERENIQNWNFMEF